MGSRLGLAAMRKPLEGLFPFKLKKFETPLWWQIGMLKRKRGRLGFDLLRRKILNIPYKDIFNRISQNEINLTETRAKALERINARRQERAEAKGATVKPKKRSIRHSALSITAYVLPSLLGGLGTGAAAMAAGGPFAVGFGAQVVDATRLDVGQTVLDTIKDNEIDLTKPDAIERGMQTSKVVREIYGHSALSVATEAAIAFGSWKLGAFLAGKEGILLNAMGAQPEQIAAAGGATENLSHSASRAAPIAAQGSASKGLSQLIRPLTALSKNWMVTVADKGVEMTGEGIKFGARALTKRSTRFALQYITEDTLPLLIAQHGETLGRVIFHQMKERGELKEISPPAPPGSTRYDENGNVYYDPSAWTGRPSRHLQA